MNNPINIEFNELVLSTITVESKVSNINFKEINLIKQLLSLTTQVNKDSAINEEKPINEDDVINNENVINENVINENKVINESVDNSNIETIEKKINEININETEIKSIDNINSNILKIGCNYGEYISDLYLELTKPVKKSNRGRKKKVKKESTRKTQGNGKYFNSQITFTILDNENLKKFYHLKLFTNGTIQIPFVCNENIESITYVIQMVINTIKQFTNIKVDIDEEIDIVYIKSIMRNYKFNIIDESLYIDLNKFQNILLNFKEYIANDYMLDVDNQYYNDNVDLSLYKDYINELTALPLVLIKYSNERYVGCLIKFKTPIPSNEKKLTTVKIFSSGKINLDGCNSKEEAAIIKNILLILIKLNKDYILYRKIAV